MNQVKEPSKHSFLWISIFLLIAFSLALPLFIFNLFGLSWWIQSSLLYLIQIIILYLLIRWKFSRNKSILEYGLKTEGKLIRYLISGGILAFLSMFLFFLLIYVMPLGNFLLQDVNYILVLEGLVFHLIVAFSEELIYRGFALQEMMPEGEKKAIILTSFLFMLFHFPIVIFTLISSGIDSISFILMLILFLNLFLVGIFLGYLTIKVNGSLWFAIGFHYAWNFFQYYVFFGGFFTPQYTIETIFLTGGGYGPEGGILGTVIISIFIILSCIYLNTRKHSV